MKLYKKLIVYFICLIAVAVGIAAIVTMILTFYSHGIPRH